MCFNNSAKDTSTIVKFLHGSRCILQMETRTIYTLAYYLPVWLVLLFYQQFYNHRNDN